MKYFSVSRKTKAGRTLTGPLPSFNNAPRLFVLQLDGNDLSGTIPSDFLSASLKVQSVDLRFNALSGAVPSELDSLDKLSLLLAGNQISELPKEFCDNLDWMDGTVGLAQSCDAILCPPATASALGRIRDANESCTPCTENPLDTYFGNTECSAPGDERSILVNFFKDAGGDKWIRNDFWNTPTDHCDWYGVGCVDGKVVMINLQDNNVHGDLTPRIFDLPRLQILWLGMNPLRTNFNNIGSASELVELQLDSVEILSLEGIHRAEGLAALNLRANSLNGTFPNEIFQLRNLRLLEMGENKLSGSLPNQFDSLPLLRLLRLSQNQLTGILPSFESSKTLLEIDLSLNELSGPIPSSFLRDALGSTEISVNISGNAISVLPAELERLDKLKIDASNNKVEAIPSELCSKWGWNDESVGSYGCNAILCPPGTWNPQGRQTAANSPCFGCNDADTSFGRTTCKAQASSAISSWGRQAAKSILLTACCIVVGWVL